MFNLLTNDQSVPGGWRPRNTLLPPSNEFGNEFIGHYRRITLETWLKVIDMYGVKGYAIAVRGTPYDDMKRWRVFKDPRIIDINLLPEPVIEEEKEEEKKSTADEMLAGASALMSSAGAMLGL